MSVTLPNAAPWTTIGARTQSMRWEVRIHGFGAAIPSYALGIGPFYFSQIGSLLYLGLNAGGDTLPRAPAITCCTGRSDVLLRVQRDVANQRYTFEGCDSAGGNCQSTTVPIAAFGPASWAGMSVYVMPGVSIASLRWFSSVVPLGTAIPNAGTAGDLADWELEGNLNDTSGHALTMSGGTSTFVSTPALNNTTVNNTSNTSVQSLQVTGGRVSVTLPNAAPWTTIGARTQSMRWEVRIHGFGAAIPSYALGIGPFYFSQIGSLLYLGLNAGGDTLPRAPAITCCTGRSDVLLRVQRDVANQRYTFEGCDSAGGNCQSTTVPIAAFGPASWAGMSVYVMPGVSIASLRWFSSVVPLGTAIPNAGTAGDLADWELEGNLNDTSGHALTMSGGTSTFVSTPAFVPFCNAGEQQVFRAGSSGQLDGRKSTPLDGGTTLNYLWTQMSGAAVNFSGSTAAQPTITGIPVGSYAFQLTVTDGSRRSSVCTVVDGSIVTDTSGVIITGTPAVDALIGPLMSFGMSPWPWLDDRHKAAADLRIAQLDTYYPAYWDVADAGSVSVTQGSYTVSGSGTAFTTLFCQGPGSPTVPISGAAIIIWHPLTGGTGRRELLVKSCQSDTQLTFAETSPAGWQLGTGTGLRYADNANRQWWSFNSAPANYYDNVAAFYSLYYRSGLTQYRDAARKLADRFWASPQTDQGMGLDWPARSASVMGMVLRALDGRPEMWDGLHKVFDYYGTNYIGGDDQFNKFDYVWGPGLWDEREVAYHLAIISYCAAYDTDPNYRTKCKRWVGQSMTGIFQPQQSADGGWHTLRDPYNSYSPATTSVALTHGQTAVTGVGTSWAPAQFAPSGALRTAIWFINSTLKPSSNAGGDPVVYYPTYMSGTQLTLDRPYEGTTGTHGWVMSVSPTVDVPYVGYGQLPYMMGLLAMSFDIASKSLADTDPVNSALARRFNLDAANWIKTYGYQASAKSVYYMAQYPQCQKPISETNPLTSFCLGDRSLSSEAMRGMMLAYAATGDTALRTLVDTMYNAEWAKPSTCPSGSTVCVPDGTYLSVWDDNGWDMTNPSPTGTGAKWFGQMWGISALPAWPAVRLGR